MTKRGQLAFTLVTLLASGCATTPRVPTWNEVAARTPAATVTARRETQAVATANADAADDPAIWRNAADPAASLIVATDKKAGLNVYDFSGRLRSAVPAGRVNNVDLVETPRGVIVAASDRNDPLNAKIALYRLDTVAARLVALGSVAAGAGEGYGICMAARGAGVDVFMVVKDGTIRQVTLDLSGGAPIGRVVRTMKLATQSEGCVVDTANDALFVAEEDVGLWRFDARAEGGTVPTSVAKVDGQRLVADVEGVTLAGGLLLVSSQGDNAYAAWDAATLAYVGRFRIAAGALGATSETDGIAAATGDFGPDFPEGAFIAQDGDNRPAAQNFKLVDWREVRRALGR
jgi:3-phytase